MTNLVDPAAVQLGDKQFGNLRALLALEGYALWRSCPNDGHISFFASGPGWSDPASLVNLRC